MSLPSSCRLFRPGIRAARDRRGVTAVEFALIAPILLMVLAGVVDMSRYIWDEQDLTQAARAGVQYAINNPSDFTNTEKVMRSATSLGGEEGFSASADQCACASSAMSTLSWSACSSLSCGSAPEREYLKLSASYPFTSIFGRMSFLPASLSSTVILRIQ